MFQAPGKTRQSTLWLALVACLSSAAFASTGIVNSDDEQDPLAVAAAEEISTEAASQDHDASDASPRADLVDQDVPAALAGVAADDAREYRRQMYRTDI